MIPSPARAMVVAAVLFVIMSVLIFEGS